MEDLFFQISKKVMFGNCRFVTTKNILKSHHKIYISMLTVCYSNRELLREEKCYSIEKYVH